MRQNPEPENVRCFNVWICSAGYAQELQKFCFIGPIEREYITQQTQQTKHQTSTANEPQPLTTQQIKNRSQQIRC